MQPCTLLLCAFVYIHIYISLNNVWEKQDYTLRTNIKMSGREKKNIKDFFT